jgi:hypothetical protein
VVCFHYTFSFTICLARDTIIEKKKIKKKINETRPTVDIMKACSQTIGKFSKPIAVSTSSTPGKKKKKIYNPGPKTSGVLLQEQIMQLMIMIETRLKKYDIPIVGSTGFSFPTTSYEIIPPITGSATPVFMNWDHYAKNDFAKYVHISFLFYFIFF